MEGRKIIGRVAKWIGIAVATVMVLAVVAVGACVWILTPSRLTPIVRDIVAEALPGAEFSLSRVELTFWSTFPKLYIELDSIAIDNCDFPTYDGRRVMAADRIRGGVDLTGLAVGRYSIYDVELTGVKFHLVALNDSISNISALLPPDDEDDIDESQAELPEFSINRFDITDSLTVSYRNVADSLAITLKLRPSMLIAGNKDGYDIDMRSNVTAWPFHPLNIDRLRADVNGRIIWSANAPTRISLENFCLNVGDIPVKFSTEVNFETQTEILSGNMELGPMAYGTLLTMVDASKFPELKKLDTDMAVRVTAALKSAYVVGRDSLTVPDLTGSVEIKECEVNYDRLHFTDVALLADFDIDGMDLDKSVIDVKKFSASGRAASASFGGSATNLFTDPRLSGKMKLQLALSRLPKALLHRMGMEASGDISLDATGKFRMSDFSHDNFYRADLKGRLVFSDLNVAMPDSGVVLYTRKAVFGLGTQTSYKGTEDRVDSLLMAAVEVDTLSLTYAGNSISMTAVKGGFGCENRPPSSDTTAIVPLGAGLKIKNLNVVSADSVKIRMRGASVAGRVQRYRGDSHVPHISLTASATSIVGSDGHSFIGLRGSEISADAHQRVRQTHFRSDSIRHRGQRRQYVPADTVNTIEFADKGVAELFNRWKVTGSIAARRGMMYTPVMPIRNRITDLDLKFSTDSVVLNSLKYKGGRSDFAVTGTISNIRKALNRRGDMVIRCSIASDTLDIDQLLHVAAQGSAYMSGDTTVVAGVTMDDIDLGADAGIDTDAQLTAILIPTNIDADLDVTAKNVLYDRLPVHDFSGCLMIKDGAMNLRELRAQSGIGGVSLSALYSAPSRNDIRFGIGLQLDRIDVHNFIELMPAVDSIMPLLGSFNGIINADIAATADVDSLMNIELPSLDAVVKLSGDSLNLLDAQTFRTLKKWLRFKGTNDNQIEHMEVEMLIRNSTMEIFPFVFNFDRYRLAVMGTNDLDLNFKYHVSVLKSPIPFKFGLNLSGNPDNMKVRFGGAKYKEGMVGQSVALVDTTRINLLEEMQRIFSAGASKRRLDSLKVNRTPKYSTTDAGDTALSHADSIAMIREGLIELSDSVAGTDTENKTLKKK